MNGVENFRPKPTQHNNLLGLNTGNYQHLSASQLSRVSALIYQNSVNSIAVSVNNIERGIATAVSVIYNILTKDDQFVTASITGGIGNVLAHINQGNVSASAGSLSQSASFILSMTYNRNSVLTAESKTISFNALTPQWKGISETASFTTYSSLSALTKAIQASAAISNAGTATNQYFWFISNKNNATIKDANGFTQTVGTWDDGVSEFYLQPLILTLADSSTVNVYAYRTRNLKTATLTYNIS